MKTMIQKNPSDCVILICSTPFSRRIKKKCFRLVNDKPVLLHIIDRIQSLKLPIALLIPPCAEEYAYRKLVHGSGYEVEILTGNAESPLHRMADYLKAYGKDYKYVMRITHDDIIIDDITAIELLNGVRAIDADYGYSPTIIEGAGVEIIKKDILIKRAEEIKSPVEHVSYFVKGEKQFKMRPRQRIERNYRLTMDYEEDVIVLESLLHYLGNNVPVDRICKYIDSNPMVLKYNELPEISVYTCMKNASKWIVDCIGSVILSSRISGTQVEYILIDDGSNDDTLIKALAQIGMWDAPKCKIYVNERNIGLASSSNRALNLAKGKYILRVDADDIIEPQALRNMLAKIKKEDAVILYPDYYEYNEEMDDSNIVSGWVHHHAGGALMNKKVINELKFKEGLKHWDSLELYQRIRNHKNFKITYLQDPLFKYRKHPYSLSNNKSIERLNTYDEIMKNIKRAE